MSKNNHQKKPAARRRGRERHVRIRSEPRTQPDLRKIAGAVVAIALAQAEKDAQAERAARESSND